MVHRDTLAKWRIAGDLRKECVNETKTRPILNAHWIKEAIEMITFMLHNAGMKAGDAALQRRPESVEASIV